MPERELTMTVDASEIKDVLLAAKMGLRFIPAMVRRRYEIALRDVEEEARTAEKGYPKNGYGGSI